MNKKIIGKIIVICLILIIILLVCLFTMRNKQENKKVINVDDKISNKELEQVKSATAYFTVESCVNKYINYILLKDSESIYNILDSNYIDNNKITKNNVLDKINNNIDEQVTFEAMKMYIEPIDENCNKYYVSGILKRDEFEDSDKITVINDNYNVAVILNLEDMIFSITPLENGGILNEKNN